MTTTRMKPLHLSAVTNQPRRYGRYCEKYLWSASFAPPETSVLRSLIERPETAYLWGKPYRIVPRLIGEVFGDGRQLMYLSPLNTRPNYYVVRIDSEWDLHDSGDEKFSIREHLDSIYEAIEYEYGRANCGDDDLEEQYEAWPAFDDSVGTSWGGMGWPISQSRTLAMTEMLRWFRAA